LCSTRKKSIIISYPQEGDQRFTATEQPAGSWVGGGGNGGNVFPELSPSSTFPCIGALRCGGPAAPLPVVLLAVLWSAQVCSVEG